MPAPGVAPRRPRYGWNPQKTTQGRYACGYATIRAASMPPWRAGPAAGARRARPGRPLRLGGVVFLVEFLARDRLVGHLGELDDIVHHLLLEDRRPQGRDRVRIFAVVVPNLLLAPGILARLLDDRPCDLVVGNLDIVLVADFRKDEAEPDPAVGDAAILLGRLFLGRALVREGAVLRLQVGLDGAPHILELLLHQGRRRIEFVQLVELVEQGALELLAAYRGVLARQPVPDRALELVERLHAERLGEILVDRHFPRGLDRFRRHLEDRRLAGQVGGQVVLREGDIDGAGLPRRHPDQLVLESGNEGIRADLNRDVVAGAALEGLAIDRPGELHRDPVAFFDLAALAFGTERPGLLGDLADRFLDFGVGYLGGQPLQRDLLEIGERDLRDDLERDRVGEVRLAGDDPFDLALALRHGDLGIHGELEAAIGDDLGISLAHHLLDRLGHRGAAIDLPEVGDRHLAGPEPTDLDPVLELGQAVVEPRVEVGGRHHHLELALEAVAVGFGHLHGSNTRH